MLIGYARVSTSEQDTALQLDALKAAGVKRIFSESESGVGPRPQLQRALHQLKRGQILVVWKLDRIARSLMDLLRVLDRLQAVGAGLRSLTEPIDTSTPVGEFVIQILGAAAQLERALIRERCDAGRQAARARGVRFGRDRSLRAADEAALVKMYFSGWYTMRTLARMFDVHESSVKRAIYRVAKPGHSSLQ